MDGVGANVKMVMVIEENERARRKGGELEVDMLDDEPR